MPVYLVKNKRNPEAPVRVIEADNASQVTRHVCADTFVIEPGKVSEVANLIASGTPLENASKPQRELALED